MVAHIDGNRLNNCPSNLRWATNKENCEDTVRHGRSNRGERCPTRRFSDSEVRIIRRMYAEGASQRKMAVLFGAEQSTISHICRRKTWAHVD